MQRSIFFSLFTLALLSLAAGCGSDDAPTETKKSNIDGSKYVLSEEPKESVGVIAVRKTAKDNEEVVVVGIIGGHAKPWTEGRAAFMIVDTSLNGCTEDGCTTPWDYCCETDLLPTSTVQVQFVDEEGKVLKADARELLNLKSLQQVVIRGKAKCDDQGRLLNILADGVFVQK